MKKLILLLFIPLIFACSEDEDTSQNFLEKYDGIVWEVENYVSNPYYGRYITFYNDSNILFTGAFVDPNSSFVECDEIYLGYREETGTTLSIFEENESELILQLESNNSIEYVSISVDSNGILTFDSDANDIYNSLIYNQTNINDPCN